MRDKIEQLVAEELARANDKFPGFASNHEAYAVLLEEVEELGDDLDTMTCEMGGLWRFTKAQKAFDTRVPKHSLERINRAAINAAMEAIQAAAMAKKWIALLDKEKTPL